MLLGAIALPSSKYATEYSDKTIHLVVTRIYFVPPLTCVFRMQRYPIRFVFTVHKTF